MATRFTAEEKTSIVAEFIEAHQTHGTSMESWARANAISSRTLWDWAKDHPNYKRTFQRYRTSPPPIQSADAFQTPLSLIALFAQIAQQAILDARDGIQAGHVDANMKCEPKAPKDTHSALAFLLGPDADLCCDMINALSGRAIISRDCLLRKIKHASPCTP